MKRTLSLVLSLIMILGIFASMPVTVNAASVDDLTFTLNEDGESYSVSRCTISAEGEITIPSTYKGKSVTKIGDSAFLNCSNLTSVVIPGSVTSIGYRAFSACHKLVSVIISEGLINIGNCAFSDCGLLSSIKFPNSVTSIGDEAFYACSNLTTIEFPNSVTSIGAKAFYGCSNLTLIVIPESVVSIGNQAFDYCKNLNAVYITDISSWCNIDFAGCYANPLYYAGNLYLNDKLVTELVIPEDVINIGKWAFYKCTSLKSVIGGDSVTSIGDYAFSYCTNLTSIAISDSVTSIGNAAFYNCESLTSIIIPNNVTSIGGSAFSGCTSLTSMTIPDSVTNVGGEAFYNCTSLEKVFWNAKRVNDYSESSKVFYKAGTSGPGIKFVFGDMVERIPAYFFHVSNSSYSPKIISTTIDKNITSIGTCAFYRNPGIVFYTGSKSEWDDISIAAYNEGFYYVAIHYNSTGHTPTEWIIDSPATCQSDGLKHGVCSVCNIRVEDVVPAYEHTPTDWIIDQEPHCVENGYKHTECTVCGETVETAIIPGAEDHDWSTTGEVVVAPTCTETGTIRYGCNNCYLPFAEHKYETIPATGHDFYWVHNEPTCLTNGFKEKRCRNCFELFEDETIPATGHTSSDWIIDSQATINAPGKKHKECTTCGEVIETATIIQLKPSTPKVTTTNEIGGVNVTWNKVDGAVKYNVYCRQGGYSTWTLVGTTTGTTLLDKNVKSGIYYVYSVRAYNVSGGYSDFVSANTNTRKYMAVPQLTGISNATNGFYIKWNPVSGVTNGYRVYRRGAGSVHWYYLGTVKTNYFTDTTIKNNSGEYYRYTVIADGGYHSKFDTTGLYLKRLANPTLISAVSSKSGITVKWGSVKTATDYYVYRKTANSGWVRIATLPGNSTTTYLDKTAKKGTTYTYTVRACSGSTISYFNSGINCYDKY